MAVAQEKVGKEEAAQDVTVKVLLAVDISTHWH